MARAPLSLKKLVYLDGRKAVLYRSRMNPFLGRNFEAMDPLEWLARLADHIPDTGKHRTHSCGFYASRVRAACAGGAIGYFCIECRDNQWWVPVHSTWAARSDCRMVRLSYQEKNGQGTSAAYWRRAAPRRFALSGFGTEWRNAPAYILGFAQSADIQWVAEKEGYPVPESVRPYLGTARRAGPLTLYPIRTVPVD